MNPDASVYGVALLLSSGQRIPLWHRSRCARCFAPNPYEIVKAGSIGTSRAADYRSATCCWWYRLRSAPCWSRLRWLPCVDCGAHCTATLVLNRSNAMLVGTDLHMAGYSGDRVARDAKAHDRRRCGDSRRRVCGIDRMRCCSKDQSTSNVFTDETTDLRPSNAAASVYHVPRISRIPSRRRALRCCLAERFTWHDDKNSPARGRGESGVCAQNLRLRQPTQLAAFTRCRMERAYKWWVLSKTGNMASLTEDSTAGDVSPYPAVRPPAPHGWWCARTATRSNWRHAMQEHAAPIRCRAAGCDRDAAR